METVVTVVTIIVVTTTTVGPAGSGTKQTCYYTILSDGTQRLHFLQTTQDCSVQNRCLCRVETAATTTVAPTTSTALTTSVAKTVCDANFKPTVTNGKISGSSFVGSVVPIGSKMTVQCNAGYETSGDVDYTCTQTSPGNSVWQKGSGACVPGMFP